MKVRALDSLGDWTFGKGKSNYKKDALAVSQNIKTRLGSFLGDCFFDLSAGVDWFNLNGSKQKELLEASISSIILNTEGVLSSTKIISSVNSDRKILIQYSVQTVYGEIPNGEFSQ